MDEAGEPSGHLEGKDVEVRSRLERVVVALWPSPGPYPNLGLWAACRKMYVVEAEVGSFCSGREVTRVGLGGVGSTGIQSDRSRVMQDRRRGSLGCQRGSGRVGRRQTDGTRKSESREATGQLGADKKEGWSCGACIQFDADCLLEVESGVSTAATEATWALGRGRQGGGNRAGDP
jgi:hypothetical protein